MTMGKYRRLLFGRPNPLDFREMAFVYGVVWAAAVIGSAVFVLNFGPLAGRTSVDDDLWTISATLLGSLLECFCCSR